jgi:hypothetical protein
MMSQALTADSPEWNRIVAGGHYDRILGIALWMLLGVVILWLGA